MIPNEGKAGLLESQLGLLATLKLGLCIDDLTIDSATVLSDVEVGEASWAGYARVPLPTWDEVSIVSDRARTPNLDNPQFTNSSGSPQTFYVVFMVDEGNGRLIWALNIGSAVIPDGVPFGFFPVMTDDNDGSIL